MILKGLFRRPAAAYLPVALLVLLFTGSLSCRSGQAQSTAIDSLVIKVNDRIGTNFAFVAGAPATIQIQSSLARPSIFYSLNGSRPSAASTLYTAPFNLNTNAVIRAIAYGSDFSTTEAGPVTISFEGEVPLEVNLVGQGSVQRDPDHHGYNLGETVKLTALPAPFFRFSSWENGDTSSVRNLTISASNNVTAYFTNTVPVETQYSLVKESLYSEPTSHGLQTVSVVSDGSEFIVAANATAPNRNLYYAARLDSAANVVWQNFYWGTYSDAVSDLIRLANGTLLIAGWDPDTRLWPGTRTAPVIGGSDSWMVYLDGDGKQRFDLALGTTNNEQGVAIGPTADGGYFAALPMSNDTPVTGFLLARVNRAGNLVFQQAYPSLGGRVPVRVFETTEGCIVIASHNVVGANQTVILSEMELIRFDAAGKLVAEAALNLPQNNPNPYYYCRDALRLNDGRIVALVQDYPRLIVAAFHPDGTGSWIRVYSAYAGLNQYLSLTKIAAEADNRVWILGEDEYYRPNGVPYYFTSPRLIHLTSEGEVLDDFVCKGARQFSSSNPQYQTFGIGPHQMLLSGWTEDQKMASLILQAQVVPLGTPQVLVDGMLPQPTTFTNRVEVPIKLGSHLPGARIFYTLDGSTNMDGAIPYGTPFTVTTSVVVRAFSVTTNGLLLASEPVPVQIFPNYRIEKLVRGGGNIYESGGTLYQDTMVFPSNTVAQVQAYGQPGWYFRAWRGDLSGDAFRPELLMDGPKQVGAVFSTPVATSVTGQGRIAAFPPPSLQIFGFSAYDYGTDLQMVALPSPGYYFALWGGAASGITNGLHFPVITTQPTVSALFSPLGPGEVALTAFANGTGSVMLFPDQKVYQKGDRVTARAVVTSEPFLGWSGASTSKQPEITIELTDSAVLAANFAGGNPEFLTDQFYLAVSPPVPPEPVAINLFSVPGTKYRIESSTDLRAWTPVANSTLTNGFVSLPQLDRLRFFRAAPVP